MESAPPPPPPIPVPVQSSDFTAAVERYMNDNTNDLDPLQKRQMKDWSFHWTSKPTNNDDDDDPPLLAPAYQLVGTLEWSGEYITIVLDVACSWRGDGTEGKQKGATSEEGSEGGQSLIVSCQASAREIALPAFDESTATKEEKKKQKIHTKVLKRFRKDDYVAKLLAAADATPLEVFRATIRVDPGTEHFEERVNYSSDVAESIRRAVFTTAEAAIDVLDVICRFPFLPGTEQTTLAITTPLADRAILRVLEDATFEACEEEGDEEIVEDLQLEDSKRSKKDDSGRETKRAKKR